MERIISWLNNQKLYYKMLFIVVGVCVLLLAGFSSALQIVCNVYNELIYEKMAQVSIAYSEQIETQLEKLEMVTLAIIGDDGMQEELVCLRDEELNTLEKRDLLNELVVGFHSHCYGIGQLRKVSVYLPKDNELHSVVGGNMKLSEKEITQLVETAGQKAGGMDIVVQGSEVYLVRRIRERLKLTLTDLGTIIGEVDIRSIMKECSKPYADSETILKASVFVGEDCIYSDGEMLQPMKRDGWKIKQGGFVTQYTSKRGWTYLFYTPCGEIFATIRSAIVTVLFMAGIILLLVLLISRYFIGRTLRQLDELVHRFDSYAKGALPAGEEMLVYKDRQDEIGYLNQKFEQMVYTHKQLEDENYQRMLLHKEAQYKQLQHQIRPHFIFNTLSMISWTAYCNHDIETVTLTKALSELLRGSMATNEEIVTLEREMKLVEHYMYILRTRYLDRVDFKIEIPDNMLDVRIPYMTLQPIIENAVNYGLEEELAVCCIRVSGYIDGDSAVLNVEDNGPGIESDILEQLASGQKQFNGNGVGLLNVQKRIQLAFSEEYGLSFYRVDNRTQVRITIPKERNDSNVQR